MARSAGSPAPQRGGRQRRPELKRDRRSLQHLRARRLEVGAHLITVRGTRSCGAASGLEDSPFGLSVSNRGNQ